MPKKAFAAKTFASRTYLPGNFNGVGGRLSVLLVKVRYDKRLLVKLPWNEKTNKMARLVDIEIFEGEDKQIIFEFDPIPSDGIGSMAFEFAVRRFMNDSAALFSKSSGSFVTIDASNAVMSLNIDNADTKRTTGTGPGTFFWALRRSDSGNKVLCGAGKFKVWPCALSS